MKPYSPSCDDNKDPILNIIKPYLREATTLLEIGSGTGQHAVYFIDKLNHLTWQTSDLSEHLSGIEQWLNEVKNPRLLKPIQLDVSKKWPNQTYDAVFSANALHIMNQQQVADFFSGLKQVTHKKSQCLLYGPFNYAGQYSSESNRNFDLWLKQRNPDSCIKNFEDINALAQQAGFKLKADHAMPANNRLLVFMSHSD